MGIYGNHYSFFRYGEEWKQVGNMKCGEHIKPSPSPSNNAVHTVSSTEIYIWEIVLAHINGRLWPPLLSFFGYGEEWKQVFDAMKCGECTMLPLLQSAPLPSLEHRVRMLCMWTCVRVFHTFIRHTLFDVKCKK